MPAALKLIQESEQPNELGSLEHPLFTKLNILIHEIKTRTDTHLNEKTPESMAGITDILDVIKTLFVPLSREDIQKILQKMQDQDSVLWNNFKWQNIDWKNRAYHERNSQEKDMTVGINTDQLLQIAERDPVNRMRILVLKLTEIYGLDPKLLSRSSN